MFMKETYPPIPLELRAKKLREKHRNPLSKSKFASNLPSKIVFEHAIIRPLNFLFMSPIVGLLSIHMAITFGLFVPSRNNIHICL